MTWPTWEPLWKECISKRNTGSLQPSFHAALIACMSMKITTDNHPNLDWRCKKQKVITPRHKIILQFLSSEINLVNKETIFLLLIFFHVPYPIKRTLQQAYSASIIFLSPFIKEKMKTPNLYMYIDFTISSH